MPRKLVLLLYESWDQIDGSVEGLTHEEATTRHDGGSSIAWTVGHVTTMVDSWINARFQDLPRQPFISSPNYLVGGSGEEKDWQKVLAASAEVRETARGFLDSEPLPDLDQVVPYDGSIEFLRQTGLRLSYALMRIAAHHFMHAGEIVTVRSRLGHDTDELFGSDWGRSLA